MGINLNTNPTAFSAARYLNMTNNQLSKSLERLASGSKFNRAGDGAGILLVSENLRSQIRGTEIAASNAQQGLSMAQAADSAIQQITEHLQAMRDITVAASNGTTSTAEFAAYAADYAAHSTAITAIAGNAVYNGTELLDGTGGSITLQVGANSGETIALDLSDDYTATGLSVSTTTLTSTADAGTRMGEVDAALQTVSTQLATLGGSQGQLEAQINYLSIAQENLTASESSIRSADVAMETANVTRLQILSQAAAYALSQANSMPTVALRLLQ